MDAGADQIGSDRRSTPHQAGSNAWYGVWTRSHCERQVAEHLSAKGFPAFLPEMGLWSTRAGQTRVIHVPMFPGYLFVHAAMDKQRYVEMLKVRGIVRILEDGWTRLTPIPDAQVHAIQRLVDAQVPVFPYPHLRHGDRVRVVDGPLTGLEGIFVHDKLRKGRLVLSVDLLGRSVSAEVDCTAVTPC
jgi:transcription antitermination factor NusG